ncbi:MAG: sigma-54 dependent transcriptional regulator [Terriglobales bacterium]
MTTLPVTPNGADHVLVASPNVVVRQRVLDSLRPGARRVEQASGGAEALVHLEKEPWQVLFLDRRLPDLDAEELRQTVRERFPNVEVVLLEDEGDNAAPAEVEQSAAAVDWRGTRVEKIGWRSDRKNGDTQNATDDENLRGQKNERPSLSPALPSERLIGTAALPGMIGISPAMQAVYRLANLVASRDTTVLIMGPTGSGKELVARALHDLSPRAARTFAAVNCAAIPETLLEAELFGYSRGSFTGALQSYAGRIQAAHQGTLFLDEIGDMPLSLQPKLLRFLEQKELQRLGSAQVVRVDTRVVVATNADLPTLMAQGKFREDLYYRLSAFPLAIPPLRERPGDVGELARHFLKQFSGDAPAPVLTEESLAMLRLQSWPGNVRELQNVMERALILADGEPYVRPEHLLPMDPSEWRVRALGHLRPEMS